MGDTDIKRSVSVGNEDTEGLEAMVVQCLQSPRSPWFNNIYTGVSYLSRYRLSRVCGRPRPHQYRCSPHSLMSLQGVTWTVWLKGLKWPPALHGILLESCHLHLRGFMSAPNAHWVAWSLMWTCSLSDQAMQWALGAEILAAAMTFYRCKWNGDRRHQGCKLKYLQKHMQVKNLKWHEKDQDELYDIGSIQRKQ